MLVLVVFGSINIDLVFPVQFLPRAGDTLWSEAGRLDSGGKGGNQAVAAARDGARVALVGAVGSDHMADVALAGPRQAGVNLDGIARSAASTGRAAVCVDPAGLTTVVVNAGANRFARADQVRDALLGSGSTVLLQMETEPAENAALIARARSRGARIILNLSPSRVIDTDALRAADLLIGNSDEIAWVGEHLGTGNNPASLYAALGVTTVRMLGPRGAEASSRDGYLHMPALPVEPRDTTGAGDCFTGVLAAALSRGLGLPHAMRRAAVAAALSTRLLGAQSSMPVSAEIAAALTRAPQPTRQQAEVPD
jgi:ribokinase